MKKTLLSIFIILFAATINAQSIKNINWESDSTKIILKYDLLSFIKGNTYNIQVFCSTDGGYTYNTALRSTLGDIGTDISLGRKKTVVWDVFKDVGGLAGMVSFKVVAERNPMIRDFFISYNGSLETPIGLQIGLLGGISPYLSLRGNTDFNFKNNYVYNDIEYVLNYPYETIYFVYGEAVKHPRYSITAGINAQVFSKGFVYLGAGYGESRLLWEVKEFNYADDSLYEVSWAQNNDYSIKGLELEGGLIIPIKKVLLKVGGSLLSFKEPAYTFGIGYRFSK
ncbi:MAG: hypothetical protein PHT69_16860 [Bacteroidales bacterium]|nr:hypothetical protein [Bacteroidales bacterium]